MEKMERNARTLLCGARCLWLCKGESDIITWYLFYIALWKTFLFDLCIAWYVLIEAPQQ